MVCCHRSSPQSQFAPAATRCHPPPPTARRRYLRDSHKFWAKHGFHCETEDDTGLNCDSDERSGFMGAYIPRGVYEPARTKTASMASAASPAPPKKRRRKGPAS